MSDLTAKRERQARRLLRVCLREFEDGCLRQYVEDYEDGGLEHWNSEMCAVGSMGRGCGQDYRALMDSQHRRSAQHVEDVFEGHGLFCHTNLCPSLCDGHRSWGRPADDATRRRWIYEACIEELARRAADRSAATQPAACPTP